MDPVNHPPHYGGAADVYEAKLCTQCKTRKALEMFPPDNRRRDGRGSKCRVCVGANRDAYYQRYPGAEAERRKRNAEHGRAWHHRNRERQIERMRWARAKRVYGVTPGIYQRMLDSQGGACAICRTKSPGRGDGYFAVDHDHATGAVRGLLCQRCNSGLGFFCDDPEIMREAAAYVERSGQPSAL